GRDAWRAGIELAYESRGERTVPALRRHYGPLRVQRGLLPEGPGVWHQVLVHPPGGIASNEDRRIDVTARAGARALLTAPGAARWYRARHPGSPLDEPGTWASQSLRLRVEAGASLEWLPLESIVFDGARARWDNRFEVAHGASLVAAEPVCLGQPAGARPYARGRPRWRPEIRRRGGQLDGAQAAIAGGDRMAAAAGGPARGDDRFGVAHGASLVAAELVCLGEPASARPYARGCLRWRTEIRGGGRLLDGEQAAIAGGDRMLASAAGLCGHPVFGTLC